MTRSYARTCVRQALAAAIAMAIMSSAQAAAVLPTGPSVLSGLATVTPGADTLTVDQTSQAASIDWATFAIGPGGTLVFNLPGSATSNHAVASGGISRLDGTWLGTGTVAFDQRAGSIGMAGAYAGIGGARSSLSLHAGNALAFTGSIATQGGDVTLSADNYLFVGGQIDLGSGLGGTLHLSTRSDMYVSDTVTSVMDPETGTLPVNFASAVAAQTLNGVHGGLDLYAGASVGIYSDVAADGSIKVSGTGIMVGTGNDIYRDTILRAGTQGGPVADLLLHANSWMVEQYGALLTATGKVRLESPNSSADLLGTIVAPRVELVGWRFAQTQQPYGSAIITDSLGGTADEYALWGRQNQIGALNGLNAALVTLENSKDISGANVVVSDWMKVRAVGHDINLTGADNRISALSATGRNVSLVNGGTVHLVDIDADNLSVTATGDIDNLVGVDTSLVVRGDTNLRTDSGRVELAGDFGGAVHIVAGSGDVWLSGSLTDRTDIFGRDVRIQLNGRQTVGFLSGANSVLLDSGADPDSVLTADSWITTPLLKTRGHIVWTNIGPLPGAIDMQGTLTFASAQTQVPWLNNAIRGTGTLVQAGPTTLVLNGEIDGIDIRVDGGQLVLGDGTSAAQHVRANVAVNPAGSLSGNAMIDGAVNVASGARLSPGNGIGSLSVGSLSMDGGSTLSYSLDTAAPTLDTYGQSDSITVAGDVHFNGPVTLGIDPSHQGYFTPGFYHVLGYGGSLFETGGGLQTDSPLTYTLIRDVAKKSIDLLYTPVWFDGGFNLWNGNGQASGSTPGGGSGTWTTAAHNWANKDGVAAAPMGPRPAFVVFAGQAGSVHVDNSTGAIDVTGMQFLSPYTLDGSAIHLASVFDATPTIRVGDSATPVNLTVAIANDLTSDNGFEKSDGGTLVLSGHNRWTGGTTISGGKLSISAAYNIGLGDVRLANGLLQVTGTDLHGLQNHFAIVNAGGIDVADANNTFSIGQGALSGTGQFIKDGAGTLALRGSQASFSGDLWVRGGTLVADPMALYLSSVSIDGILAIDVDRDNTMTSPLRGAGTFAKRGAGTLTYRGDGSSLAGTTRVEAGTLVVGADSGGRARLGGHIDVLPGATLAGNGILLGDVSVQGYVLPASPGDVLTVNGNVAFESGSALMVDTSDSSAARLAVGGAVTIAPGARLVVDAHGSRWVAEQKYDLLTAVGGVSGTFAAANSNFAFLNTLIAYSASGNISLILKRNAVALEEVAVTANQRAVASAAEGLGAGHAVYDRLITLDAGSGQRAFDSLAGTLHASVQGVVMDSQRQVRDAVMRHLGDADLPGGQRADNGRVSTWLSVLGRDANYDGNADAAKVNSSDSGILLGADLAVGDGARIGAVLGHMKETIHERASAGSADVKGNQFGLYADMAFDALHLSGGVVRAHHAIDTRRDITIGMDSTRAYASRDADTTQGFVELGHDFGRTGVWKVEPFVQAAAVYWSGDKASERGGTGVLVIDGNEAHTTAGRVGVHLGTALDRDARFGLQATLAWQRGWGDVAPEARVRFAEGGPMFDVAGAPLARQAGLLDAGLVVRLTPTLRLDASYAGQFAGKVADHGGRVSLNMTF
ncbi:autotransporter domain-containing protein [Luteibacter aegosomaticola]|uniref:autotransporter domain-containing protein n=1 Tax=Luteibacter aegosomaticola TaxID=2911538 RepID=UPI001FF9DC75|nr:autotransporter domain-containing protein [Luteibacter aegosomaticola]UPG91203.1 autotransporter domain-containing protein [Luteibacter aegosomaticola]